MHIKYYSSFFNTLAHTHGKVNFLGLLVWKGFRRGPVTTRRVFWLVPPFLTWPEQRKVSQVQLDSKDLLAR